MKLFKKTSRSFIIILLFTSNKIQYNSAPITNLEV